jgi:hypothetical protein
VKILKRELDCRSNLPDDSVDTLKFLFVELNAYADGTIKPTATIPRRKNLIFRTLIILDIASTVLELELEKNQCIVVNLLIPASQTVPSIVAI